MIHDYNVFRILDYLYGFSIFVQKEAAIRHLKAQKQVLNDTGYKEK